MCNVADLRNFSNAKKCKFTQLKNILSFIIVLYSKDHTGVGVAYRRIPASFLPFDNMAALVR